MSKEKERRKQTLFARDAKLPRPIEPKGTPTFQKAKISPPQEPRGTLTFREVVLGPSQNKPKKTEDKRG